MKREIIEYYDRLAPTYDQDRFGNSYGRFVDVQERRLLAHWLSVERRNVLEIACGTGRLSQFAQVACDASHESLKLARMRHPSVRFVAADATRLPFREQSFDAVFGLHLLMHLDRDSVRATLSEASRVLRPGGIFVADVLSAARRRFTARPQGETSWHGNTALGADEFRTLCAEHRLLPVQLRGLLFLPIQHVAARLRPLLAPVDGWLSARLPSLSSYLIGCFVKDDAR